MNKKQYSLMLVLALVAGLVGGVVSSQFFVGQPAFAMIEKSFIAQNFMLKDEKGRIRGIWTIEQDGTARLKMESDTGTIVLLTNNEGSSVTVTGSQGLTTITTTNDGTGLEVYDKTLTGRVGIGLDSTGASAALLAKDGKVIWQAP
jgi:hypothetical protein